MMEETQEMKKQNYIGYRLEGGIYHLVDFETSDTLDSMDEVSFLFDTNKDIGGGFPTLLKHGSPYAVGVYLKERVRVLIANGEGDRIVCIDIIQGKPPIEEIDKMLSISGYIMKVEE